MDVRFTPEQEALRKEFEAFFAEAMKDTPGRMLQSLSQGVPSSLSG